MLGWEFLLILETVGCFLHCLREFIDSIGKAASQFRDRVAIGRSMDLVKEEMSQVLISGYYFALLQGSDSDNTVPLWNVVCLRGSELDAEKFASGDFDLEFTIKHSKRSVFFLLEFVEGILSILDAP